MLKLVFICTKGNIGKPHDVTFKHFEVNPDKFMSCISDPNKLSVICQHHLKRDTHVKFLYNSDTRLSSCKFLNCHYHKSKLQIMTSLIV